MLKSGKQAAKVSLECLASAWPSSVCRFTVLMKDVRQMAQMTVS